jgi:hypothetical protein
MPRGAGETKMDGWTKTPHTHRGDAGEGVVGCARVWAESSSCLYVFAAL